MFPLMISRPRLSRVFPNSVRTRRTIPNFSRPPAPAAAAPEAVRPDFIEGIEDSEPQLGKIEAICAILSFVAASAACYFIVMDFLKYI